MLPGVIDEPKLCDALDALQHIVDDMLARIPAEPKDPRTAP